jgi:uncharacterized membrane protein YsdA (DUF1294 family)
MVIVYILTIYLLGMNLWGFISMGSDKKRAKMNQWRIKENTLFRIAILGGSIGSLIGMYYYHHKTKHTKFILGMPCILIFQIFLITIIAKYWFN